MSRDKQAIELDDLKKMLSAVFTLCLLSQELKDPELDLLVTSARSEAKKRIHSIKPHRAQAIDLLLLGSVLHRWNRNPKYLNEEAQPFPIREKGRAPSVEALFRAEKRTRYFEKGLQEMR